MFYDIDRKAIKVTVEDFEIYVRGLKARAFTPFASDNIKARLFTNLSADQIMFIKMNFKKLAREYKYDMLRQEFISS